MDTTIINSKFELYKWYECEDEWVYFITPGTYFILSAEKTRPATLEEYKTTGKEVISLGYTLMLNDEIISIITNDDLHLDCWEYLVQDREEADKIIQDYIQEINKSIVYNTLYILKDK